MKKSALLTTLDAILVPGSLGKYFLNHDNYISNAECHVRSMRPIVYLAETGKIAIYGGLLTYLVQMLNR